MAEKEEDEEEEEEEEDEEDGKSGATIWWRLVAVCVAVGWLSSYVFFFSAITRKQTRSCMT